jgi:hypothetical protein
MVWRFCLNAKTFHGQYSLQERRIGVVGKENLDI